MIHRVRTALVDSTVVLKDETDRYTIHHRVAVRSGDYLSSDEPSPKVKILRRVP